MDKDVRSRNSQFSHTVFAGNLDGVFSLDPSNRAVTTAGWLDRETEPVHCLILAAVFSFQLVISHAGRGSAYPALQ